MKKDTELKKEDFIDLISSVSKEGLNKIIKQNGKTKLAKPVINLKEIDQYE